MGFAQHDQLAGVSETIKVVFLERFSFIIMSVFDVVTDATWALAGIHPDDVARFTASKASDCATMYYLDGVRVALHWNGAPECRLFIYNPDTFEMAARYRKCKNGEWVPWTLGEDSTQNLVIPQVFSRYMGDLEDVE